MVQQPAHFQHERRAIFKAHKSRRKIFHIEFFGNRAAPIAESPLLMGNFGAGHTRHSHGFGIAHKPEGEVENVYANVDARAATAVLLENKTGARGRRRAAQHPGAGVVDIAQHAFVQLGFHRLRFARKAKMLSRHQQFTRFVPCGNHFFDERRVRRQRFFANDVFARTQRGNGQRRVVVIGRADIDDVDIGILKQHIGIGDEFLNAVFFAPFFEHLRIDIAACHQIGMFRCLPSRDVAAGDAAHADDGDVQFFRHCMSFLCV